MQSQNWQGRLRRALLPYYQNLPEGTKSLARKLFGVLQGPLFSARGRWLRYTYSRHIIAERRYLFLCMARFANVNRPIEGYYMEFGCFEANTMRLAYDSFHHLFDWHYVGFDLSRACRRLRRSTSRMRGRRVSWRQQKRALLEFAGVTVCLPTACRR